MKREFDFLLSVQFTTGYLLSISKRSIKNENFISCHKRILVKKCRLPELLLLAYYLSKSSLPCEIIDSKWGLKIIIVFNLHC